MLYLVPAWMYGFCLSKILSVFLRWFHSSFNISYHFNYCSANPGFGASPRVWHENPPHLFTTTSVPQLIFLFPISADGRSSHFRLRVLANHLASIFFLPLSGDSLGLLHVPVPHSLPIRSQSTNICWFPFWLGFVTSGLTYIISLNGHSLTAC